MGREVMVTTARSALVKGYASTVVNAVRTWIAEGHQYASTVVNAVSARIVEGHQYASTVVDAVGARIVEGHKCASTIVYAVRARIVSLWARALTNKKVRNILPDFRLQLPICHLSEV